MKKTDAAPNFVRLTVTGVRRNLPATQRVKYVADAKLNSGSEAGRRYAQYSQARTIGEAVSLGAVQGDLNHDLKKGFLTLPGLKAMKAIKSSSSASYASASSPRAKPELCEEDRASLISLEKALQTSRISNDRPFRHVISLGSRCVVARTIDNMSLRRYCGPFDWIYSSPQMVKHCLENNFKTFLDKGQILRAGLKWGHKYYSKMLGRSIVWPHHEPRVKDRELFERAVTRLRQIVASSERKLLILVQLIGNAQELRDGSTGENVQQLFDYLRKTRGVKSFELLAINIITGNASLARKSPLVRLGVTGGTSAEALSMMELHCLGDCTGVRFKRPADDRALRALIAGNASVTGSGGGARGSKAGRRFELLADPLPPRNGVVAKKRSLGEHVPDIASSSMSASAGGIQQRSTSSSTAVRRRPAIATAAAIVKRRRQT